MEEQKTELKMIRMSEVESQEVKWLWYPFIPYGKLTIIQGDPGDGKTTLVLNIAAKLSKGESLDSDMNVQEPVNVIYQTAEDGLADTVKPRLELAEADCEKILVIDESDKSLSMADERLEEALAKTGAKVLILDPIQAYFGGGMDMNRANEARDMTKKLGALAEKYQCAILLIGHMNKAYIILSCSYDGKDGLYNDYSRYYSPASKIAHDSAGHMITLIFMEPGKYVRCEVQGYGFGSSEFKFDPTGWQRPVNSTLTSASAEFGLNEYNTIEELMKGDYYIDINKYDPYDWHTWSAHLE